MPKVVVQLHCGCMSLSEKVLWVYDECILISEDEYNELVKEHKCELV